MTFTLVVPVDLPPGLTIESDAEAYIEDLRVVVRKSTERTVEVFVHGFEDEDAARNGFEKIKTWLAWTSCKMRLGLRYANEETPIKRFADGESIGGATGVNGREPAIYPTSEVAEMIWAGAGGVVIGVSGNRIIELLSEAAAGCATEISQTLRVGIELYSAASWEVSDYGKFLTLVNVLEVLKEQPDRSQGIQQLVGNWVDDIKAAEDSGTIDRDEASSMRSSLQFLRKRSIRSSVKAIVHDKLGDTDRAAQAKAMYDDRSRLVHDGTTPPALAESVAALHETVSLLLEIALRREQ